MHKLEPQGAVLLPVDSEPKHVWLEDNSEEYIQQVIQSKEFEIIPITQQVNREKPQDKDVFLAIDIIATKAKDKPNYYATKLANMKIYGHALVYTDVNPKQTRPKPKLTVKLIKKWLNSIPRKIKIV